MRAGSVAVAGVAPVKGAAAAGLLGKYTQLEWAICSGGVDLRPARQNPSGPIWIHLKGLNRRKQTIPHEPFVKMAIFISHAVADKKLIEPFVELLQLGINIPRLFGGYGYSKDECGLGPGYQSGDFVSNICVAPDFTRSQSCQSLCGSDSLKDV